jgi:uncharacterized protein (DUF1330 family)
MAAYLIADLEIVDAQAFEEYRRRVPAVIAAHGGRYLVRGGASEVIEGAWRPQRAVIVEFPSMDALRGFLASPDYQPLRVIRERSARSSLVAFEGVPGPGG